MPSIFKVIFLIGTSYPAFSTACTKSLIESFSESYSTVAFSAIRFTAAELTPSNFDRAPSTLFAQAAQVIPKTLIVDFFIDILFTSLPLP